ncbi:MAG: 2-oxo acid dehydrogenase subunit E2 [Thermoleophilia bacterium]|nr:2-oxo acid dehydrogenase subunit E2 [Thermoleophilia bacterium]
MGEIVMPRLTDSMEEGTIIAWLKSSGDPVAVGDELVEIETDKASMVYESDLAGELHIEVEEGATMPIGEKIATVGDGGSGDQGSGDGRKLDDSAGTVEASGEKPEPVTTKTSGGQRIKASPLARRIARDRGIDLGAVSGSGPNGRIVKADLEGVETGAPTGDGPAVGASGRADATVSPRTPSAESNKGSVETIELNRLQQTIARRMAESKATAPHFYLRAEIDMGRAVEVRAGFKETAVGGEQVPSLNDMVVKAVATALTHHPRANGAYRDGRFELYSRINVGIAVAADDALVVPTIGDADRKDLRQIATESRRLAERVRTGEITPPELSGGTFTVSNLGMFGIRSFDAVINSGQAGILAVGEIAERPVIRDGGLGSAHLMEVSLACDHRILYGAEGAKFLSEIRTNLEEPGLLA